MKREQGFILVMVLGALAALAALAAAITTLGSAGAQAGRAETAVLERMALEDSAFALAGFNQLGNPEKRWPADGRSVDVKLEGRSARIHVQSLAGLVNLNAADPRLLAAMFGEETASAIISRRPLRDMALVPRDWREFVTLYGLEPNLDPYTAPGKVLSKVPGVSEVDAEELLRARKSGNAAVVDAIAARVNPFLSGKPNGLIRIRVEVQPDGAHSGFAGSAVVALSLETKPVLQFAEMGWTEALP